MSASTNSTTKALLAIAIIALAALVVVEETRISSLRADIESLRTTHASLTQAIQAPAARRDVSTNQLTQATEANADTNASGGELHRLRAEVIRLRAEETRLRTLASESGKANESLRFQINALRLQVNGMSEHIKTIGHHVDVPLAVQQPPSTPEQQCINNLRQIDGATEQWALENKKTPGTEFVPDDIKDYLRGQQIPQCPSGGAYAFGKVDAVPTCTVPGHAL